MNKKQLFVYGVSMLAATLAGGAVAQQADERYVQVAEIEVDPVQLDAYRAAVQEQIDAAIRKEPGEGPRCRADRRGNSQGAGRPGAVRRVRKRQPDPRQGLRD